MKNKKTKIAVVVVAAALVVAGSLFSAKADAARKVYCTGPIENLSCSNGNKIKCNDHASCPDLIPFEEMIK